MNSFIVNLNLPPDPSLNLKTMLEWFHALIAE